MNTKTGNGITQDKTALEAARHYLTRGWYSTPIHLGKKAPILQDWPTRKIGHDEIDRQFSGEKNIGIICGEASGWLVDVDLDAMAAVDIAADFLPDTNMIHGRASKRRSHWWYQVSTPVKSEKFLGIGKFVPDDPKGTLVELRSSGNQTIVPPSIHTGGEAIVWERRGDPARVSGEDLRRAVAKIAAASLLIRHWPPLGSRNDASLALAGGLLRSGWSVEDASHFVRVVSTHGGDKDHSDVVAATYTKIENGQATTGWKRLGELLETPGLVDKLFKWLEFKQSEGSIYSIKDGNLAVRKLVHELDEKDDKDTEKDDKAAEAKKKKVWLWKDVILCNFTAEIRDEILYDDGVEKRRVFGIAGAQKDQRLPKTEVEAVEFAALNWVTRDWGARAVINAGHGTRDHVRAAIQSLSKPISKTIYKHTGWREVDGKHVFLYNGGAIGAEGISVDLEAPLNKVHFPPLRNLQEAIRHSLSLLDLGPLSVMVPLLGATYLAPLASIIDPDFTVFLIGQTGSFKSELLALAQQHFGAGFNRKSLPSNWSATENSIEMRASLMKDVICVIDDYAPQPSQNAQKELERKAERILRGIGNRSARGRLRSDLTQRPERVPRGLIMSSGEDLPPGQSIRARMAIVQVDKAHIDIAKLTKLQEGSRLFSEAMRGFIEYVAEDYEYVKREKASMLAEARNRFLMVDAHARQADILGALYLGMDLFLGFAAANNVITEEDCKVRLGQAETALKDLASEQNCHQRDSDTAERFKDVLSSLIEQGKIGFKSVNSEGEDLWHPGAEDAGWYDDDFFYMKALTARQLVVGALRDAGEFWPHSGQATHKALARKGYIAKPDKDPSPEEESEFTRVVRVTTKDAHHRMGTKTVRVLAFPRRALVKVAA